MKSSKLNKNLKAGIVISLIVFVLSIVLVVVTSKKVEEEEVLEESKKVEVLEESKEVEAIDESKAIEEDDRLVQIANSLRFFYGDGMLREVDVNSLSDEAIAYFIQSVSDYDLGYSFLDDEKLVFCVEGDNCINTDDIYYTSTSKKNNAYLFDKVKYYAEKNFERTIDFEKFTGDFLNYFKYEDGQDYIIDINNGLNSKYMATSVYYIEINDDIYDVSYNVIDNETKEEKVFKLEFKKLTDALIDEITFEDIQIISFSEVNE